MVHQRFLCHTFRGLPSERHHTSNVLCGSSSQEYGMTIYPWVSCNPCNSPPTPWKPEVYRTPSRKLQEFNQSADSVTSPTLNQLAPNDCTWLTFSDSCSWHHHPSTITLLTASNQPSGSIPSAHTSTETLNTCEELFQSGIQRAPFASECIYCSLYLLLSDQGPIWCTVMIMENIQQVCVTEYLRYFFPFFSQLNRTVF